MHPLNGAIRERCAPGRNTLVRNWATMVVALAVFVSLTGCGGSSGGGSALEPPLVLENFNQHLLPGVLLNSPLVFKFSATVDPQSVNINTIQIWTSIGGTRADAIGEFVTNGKTVTWFPRMTSKSYPVAPAANPPTPNTIPMMPDDAGLNTPANHHFSYNVLIPSSPNPNTVRTMTGKAMRTAFSSMFETAQGPNYSSGGNSTTVKDLFDAKAPYFRDTMRVADVLAYSGTASPATGFLGWLASPNLSSGENPLFLWPSYYGSALSNWTQRDRTGELVDQNFGIRLVPEMKPADLVNNLFPNVPGISFTDERFVSNLQGIQKGRGKEVQAINIYFTQPIGCDSFLDKANNPKSHSLSPIKIKILPTATTDPSTITAEPYTLTFLNNTALQVALVNITLNRVITQGWIHISMIINDIKGMPGGNLQGNTAAEFFYIWPVKINQT